MSGLGQKVNRTLWCCLATFFTKALREDFAPSVCAEHCTAVINHFQFLGLEVPHIVGSLV